MPLTRRDAFTLAAFAAGVALMGLPDAAFAQGLPRADGARTPVKLYGPQVVSQFEIRTGNKKPAEAGLFGLDNI